MTNHLAMFGSFYFREKCPLAAINVVGVVHEFWISTSVLRVPYSKDRVSV